MVRATHHLGLAYLATQNPALAKYTCSNKENKLHRIQTNRVVQHQHTCTHFFCSTEEQSKENSSSILQSKFHVQIQIENRAFSQKQWDQKKTKSTHSSSSVSTLKYPGINRGWVDSIANKLPELTSLHTTRVSQSFQHDVRVPLPPSPPATAQKRTTMKVQGQEHRRGKYGEQHAYEESQSYSAIR